MGILDGRIVTTDDVMTEFTGKFEKVVTAHDKLADAARVKHDDLQRKAYAELAKQKAAEKESDKAFGVVTRLKELLNGPQEDAIEDQSESETQDDIQEIDNGES